MTIIDPTCAACELDVRSTSQELAAAVTDKESNLLFAHVEQIQPPR